EIAGKSIQKAERIRESKDRTPAPAKAPKRRLSFNEKYALETLPGRIDALEKKIRELHKQLDEPGLYARDRMAFERISATLAAAQKELADAEDQWLALEVLREE